MNEKISVDENLSLVNITASHRTIFSQIFNNPKIHEHFVASLLPYDESKFDFFLNYTQQLNQKQGHVVTFAIVNNQDECLGSIGYTDINIGKSHKAEFSYWLGEPFWNQGIMSKVIKAFVNHGNLIYQLKRIQAHVLMDNHASMHVLEKVGFEREGIIRNSFQRGNELLDAALYSLVWK